LISTPVVSAVASLVRVTNPPYHPPPLPRDLPDEQHIRGDMRVIERPRLRSLGKNLRVDGDLVIGGASNSPREIRRISVAALPEKLHVGGSLELRGCFRLERLPAELHVGKSLTIADCDRLAELPANLTVHGDLTIVGGRSLTALPAGLRVAGDFRLAGTRVTELPADLMVGRSLIINGRTRITAIPPSIWVGLDLVLRHSKITAVPDEFVSNGDLDLTGSALLEKLPAGLAIKRNLILSDCPKLATLPGGLAVGGIARLDGCTSLVATPDSLTVGVALDLSGCTSLRRLGTGHRIGGSTEFARGPDPVRNTFRRTRVAPALGVADCPALTELPADLHVDGPIDVARSGLTDLPASLSNSRLLWRGVVVTPEVVFHPHRLTPKQILDEPNAELRRIMLERVGIETVLARSKAAVLDADVDPGGPRRLYRVDGSEGFFLFCQCPSTARQYLMRVPPTLSTCHEAAAWLAGFADPQRYKPVVET
jgi:hypothetical protein